MSPGIGIALIAGDGSGREISAAVVSILEAAGFQPRWETVLAGDSAVKPGTA